MVDTGALVYVMDDDVSAREGVARLIRSAGLRAETFASAQEFLARARSEVPVCLVLDVEMSGLSGLDLQAELAKADVQIPIIFLTGHGAIPMTVRAIKAGALEFLTKPFDDEDLLDAIRQASNRYHTAVQCRDLAQYSFEGIIGPKGAAARLGLARTTLIHKMKKLGITRPRVHSIQCFRHSTTGAGIELVSLVAGGLSASYARI